jgi:hypothetical protein
MNQQSEARPLAKHRETIVSKLFLEPGGFSDEPRGRGWT